METIFTVEEAAKTLKVDAQTIRRMLQQGRLGGCKLGNTWRIPESALRRVVSPKERGLSPRHEADAIWQKMTCGNHQQRDIALRSLFSASAPVQEIVMQRSAAAASEHYATPEGDGELADWRAMDGESFRDDLGDYYSEQEETRQATTS